jgi:tetratricopeptide (TPR) repeat protein
MCVPSSPSRAGGKSGRVCPCANRRGRRSQCVNRHAPGWRVGCERGLRVCLLGDASFLGGIRPQLKERNAAVAVVVLAQSGCEISRRLAGHEAQGVMLRPDRYVFTLLYRCLYRNLPEREVASSGTAAARTIAKRDCGEARMDQKSMRLAAVCDTPRQGRGRLRRVGGVGAVACLVFLVGTAAAIAQNAEALRQLEWCKNASRMVSDAHGISASTTAPSYARMAETACSKAIELFGTRQERWEAYFTRGLSYLGKSDYDLAIADFTKAIDATSIENWQPYWWRAFSHNMKASFSTGDARIAEKELALADATKAIEINPMEAMLYRNRALMHGPGQETLTAIDGAMGECAQTINLSPELLPHKGWRPGDPVDRLRSEAIIACKTAMELNGASWVPVFLRGWAHMGQRQYDLAVSDYSKAIELSPVNWRAYAYKARGLAHEGKEDIEAAISDFTKSLELRPHDDSTKTALDRALRARR